jgi:hypothetical protein
MQRWPLGFDTGFLFFRLRTGINWGGYIQTNGRMEKTNPTLAREKWGLGLSSMVTSATVEQIEAIFKQAYI